MGMVGLPAISPTRTLSVDGERRPELLDVSDRQQKAWLLISCSSTTTTVALGIGFHAWEIPPENGLVLGILGNVTASTSVFAVVFSKTSFAITLLRLTDGWMRRFVWFLIITLNLILQPTAFFFWLQCDPPEKTWNRKIDGTCWPNEFTMIYGWIAGCRIAALPRNSGQNADFCVL